MTKGEEHMTEEQEPSLQDQLGDALQSAAFYRRRVEALQNWQSKMRDPERTIVCDIIANGCTLDLLHADNRYTSPPQRPWVGLTEDEIDSALGVYDSFGGRLDARKIEAKLKEKNYD